MENIKENNQTAIEIPKKTKFLPSGVGIHIIPVENNEIRHYSRKLKEQE